MWNVKITPIKQEKTTLQRKDEYLKSHFKNEDTIHKYKVLNYINNPGAKTRKYILPDRQKQTHSIKYQKGHYGAIEKS